MIRALFDTNVLLDVLLRREPFVAPAAYLLDQVEEGTMVGLLCATTVTTIFYVGRKRIGARQTRRHVGLLLNRFEVAPVGRSVLQDALGLGFDDFEDAVLHEAARHAGAELIVTRNEKDFAGAELPVHHPLEVVRVMENNDR